MAASGSPNSDVGHVWNPWPHRLALATTTVTFLVIMAGGIVTTTGAGMAVPDWPTTFGYNMFLYPWSKMVGGIFSEHIHRLVGSVAGSLTLTLVIFLWAVEPRRWVCGLGVAALVAVVIQGVLGGLRVVLARDVLAIVHGAFAHVFFALVTGLTVFTSRRWLAPLSLLSSPDALRLRRLSLYTTIGVYVQIVLGTLVTHLGVALDAHLGAAALVSAAVIVLGFRIVRGRADWPELVLPMEMLRAFWVLQLLLGAGSYVAKFHGGDISLGAVLAVALPVSHRLGGALMLLASLVVSLRLYRRTGWPDAVVNSGHLPRRVPA